MNAADNGPRLWEINVRELAANIGSLANAARDYESAYTSRGMKNRGIVQQRFENLYCHVTGMRKNLSGLGIDLENVPERLTIQQRGELEFGIKRFQGVPVSEAIQRASAILALLPELADVLNAADEIAAVDMFNDAELPELPAAMVEQLARAEELARGIIAETDRRDEENVRIQSLERNQAISEPSEPTAADDTGREGEPPKPATPPRDDDDDAYVPFSKLFKQQDRYEIERKMKAAIKDPENKIRTSKPTPQRLNVHAGDWARHLDKMAEREDSMLDDGIFEGIERRKTEVKNQRK